MRNDYIEFVINQLSNFHIPAIWVHGYGPDSIVKFQCLLVSFWRAYLTQAPDLNRGVSRARYGHVTVGIDRLDISSMTVS